ncbi:MAG: nitrilase-related carbon-nitrogen hydrolase [Bacteroidota bacterium]
MKKILKIASIQTALYWEDKLQNVTKFTSLFKQIEAGTDIVVLPEMFTTGFSMKPEKFAERMSGDTMMWLSVMANTYNFIICGSIILKEQNQFYNRFVWVQPDGIIMHYDKKHLFTLAHEEAHYTAGEKQLTINFEGWKIRPAICYDLRFPNWLRNHVNETLYDYDILIIPANWPERRNTAWKTLLQARAIENQAYVIGVNRVGEDGNHIYHSGDSMSCDALGEILYQSAHEEKINYMNYEYDKLYEIRNNLPFLKDDI